MTLPFRNDPAFWHSDAFHRYVVETCAEGVVAVDENHRYVFVNAGMAQILGRSVDELLGMYSPDILDEDNPVSGEELVRRRRAGVAEKYEARVRRPDGSVRWVLFDARPIIDDEGRNRGGFAVVTDITDRVLAEQEARQREQQLLAAEQMARVGSWSWNVGEDTVRWSAETMRMLGVPLEMPQMPLKACLERCVHPEDRERTQRVLLGALETRAPFQFQQRVLRQDGDVGHVLVQGRVICDFRGNPRQLVGLCMDITEKKQGEQQLYHLLHHDTLTGLPNRRMLLERLGDCLARARQHHRRCALLVLDIDRFKAVNDSLGYQAGDELLVAVAERLVAAVKETDTVARLDGDTFGILLEEIHANSNAAFMARVLLGEVAKPIELSTRTVHSGAAIGIACFPDDGGDAQALLRHAEAAARRSKKSGAGSYQFYAREMGARAEHALRLAQDLEEALARDEFFLVYEPRLNLATGQIDAVEALPRWQRSGKRVLHAHEFAAIANETGRADEIDRWVLKNACRDAMRWRARGFPAVRVAVSPLSQRAVRGHFVDELCALLDETGMPARDLELVISENDMTDDFSALKRGADALAAHGVQIALGDFATGETRCVEMLELPAASMRIGHPLVGGIADNVKAIAVIEGLVLMAKRIGLTTCAEGVQSREQFEFLSRVGCDAVQGPLLGQPLPAFAMREYLRDFAAHIDSTEGDIISLVATSTS